MKIAELEKFFKENNFVVSTRSKKIFGAWPVDTLNVDIGDCAHVEVFNGRMEIQTQVKPYVYEMLVGQIPIKNIVSISAIEGILRIITSSEHGTVMIEVRT